MNISSCQLITKPLRASNRTLRAKQSLPNSITYTSIRNVSSDPIIKNENTIQTDTEAAHKEATTPRKLENDPSAYIAQNLQKMRNTQPTFSPFKHPKTENQGSPATPNYLEMWQARVASLDHNLHLSPRTGRTVMVTKSGTLAQRLGSLNAVAMVNRIPQRFNQQRFHERPGLKRKRLHKTRWRKRFAAKFNSICKRVTKLSAQGW